MARATTGRLAIVAFIVLTVANCEGGTNFNFLKPRDGQQADTPAQSGSTRLVARDVEAPGVFQVTDNGLWDGRPSLGGVWIAHPDVKDPERVIIRNRSNGKFVIGALFRRERQNPGPVLQVSSDAADALGMLAGQPSELNVTALRREEVSTQPASIETLDAPETVDQTTLDPVASAAAAIDAAENGARTSSKPVPKPAGTRAAAPVRTASPLSKPYIQLGIFSVKTNATGTAGKMRAAGIAVSVEELNSKGKTFWRVLVGPAQTGPERAALLKKVGAMGFTDAYFVSS
jgi:cell division septation protein DedD